MFVNSSLNLIDDLKTTSAGHMEAMTTDGSDNHTDMKNASHCWFGHTCQQYAQYAYLVECHKDKSLPSIMFHIPVQLHCKIHHLSLHLEDKTSGRRKGCITGLGGEKKKIEKNPPFKSLREEGAICFETVKVDLLYLPVS